jgi:hypothetical protein
MEYPAASFSRDRGPEIESIPSGIPLSNLIGYTAADIDGIERLWQRQLARSSSEAEISPQYQAERLRVDPHCSLMPSAHLR